MNHPIPAELLASLRPEARDAPESGIVEVFNYGRGREGLIPLWAGEGDLPTPGFIIDAAEQSLRDGETFYTWQRGLPPLRQALADYHRRFIGKDLPAERFFVTGSGMHAIQIAVRMVAGKDDEVLVPTPAWPNISAAAEVAGARVKQVPMHLGNAGWVLDIERLFAAATPRTKAIFINSPSNPTGWTATHAELAAILAFARQRGLWIIADEVYGRFYWGSETPPAGHPQRAPSFYDVAEPDDRVLYVNTFSKNWAMTGWRMGWLSAPPALGQVIENMVQYSNSGVAAFMQRGAMAALTEGDWFIDEQVARARRGREIVCGGLEATGKARFTWPDGAFYLFFAVEGEPETRQLGLRLVDEALLGIAPGDAFGLGGQGYLRLCFARGAEQLTEATKRLAAWLTR